MARIGARFRLTRLYPPIQTAACDCSRRTAADSVLCSCATPERVLLELSPPASGPSSRVLLTMVVRSCSERRRDPNRMDQSELVLIEPNGTNERAITPGTDPTWSPDDSLILFKAMDAAGELFVSVVSPTTRKVTRLARGVHPQWSPNGGRIVYMVDRPDHSSDIYTMRLSDRSILCITCVR